MLSYLMFNAALLILPNAHRFCESDLEAAEVVHF